MFERPVTIPDYFWDAASSDEKREIHCLDTIFGLLLPSGSRFICPGKHDTDADLDVFAVGTSKHAHDLLSNGWQAPDHPEATPEAAAGRASKADRSISLYYGNLNLILFFDGSRAARFAEATSFARDLRLEGRDQRVKVFKAICREN